MSVGELAKGERQFAQHGESKRSLYPFGYGDGGGGPDPGDARVGAPRSPISTACRASSSTRSRRSGRRCAPKSPDLPVWVGELYLEYHRGTYTTNGPIKRANRRNEQALRAAELWSVAAARRAATGRAYPADALDEAWKLLLLNQFHDIIPGSSIHWANEDCLRDHARIAAVTTDADRRRAAGDRRAGRHHRR